MTLKSTGRHTLKSTGRHTLKSRGKHTISLFKEGFFDVKNNEDQEEYLDYIDFEWEEFFDAVRDGSMIPGEDGKAVVRWYPK